MDENLYSRQLLTFGKDAMDKISNSKIFISGMGGLGIEIAKNIILAGVNTVTIHDSLNIVKTEDSSTSYWLNESDIGTSKVDKILPHLQSLNLSVNVEPNFDILNKNNFKKYDMIVLCDYNIYDILEYENYCNINNIKFLLANTHGLYGYIFCDFGNNFVTYDTDGESIKSSILVQTEGDDNNIIVSNEPHELQVNDCIIIKINGKDSKKYTVTKIVDINRFILNESPFTEKVLTNTEFYQIKNREIINFLPLESSILNPTFVEHDFCNPNKSKTLHLYTKIMWLLNSAQKSSIFNNNGKFVPKPWNENDALEIINMLKDEEDITFDEDMFRKLSYTCAGKLCPLNSIIGGIASQEIIKGCTCKYRPIHQWLYYDVIDIFPDMELPFKGDLDNYLTEGTRYDSQNIVLGKKFTENLNKKNVFIVGAGAIGCEHLKNFSMIGIGNLTVTDMDYIEKSNLNRQFLFRNSDIGKSKSYVASLRTSEINPTINVTNQTLKVCSETSNFYNYKFFDKIDCVTNALDNIEARLYVDSLCLKYNKPLIESGTLGTKCNTQVILPNLSESYGSSRDPPEKSIPVCTLKLFPYLFEHTVQYSRDLMEGYFKNSPDNYKKITNQPKLLEKMDRSELIQVLEDIKLLTQIKIKDIGDCISLSFILWHKLFRDPIYNIRNKFPEKHKNMDGTLFWSGTKKFPSYFSFDIENETHLGFIIHMTFIWMNVYKIKEEEDKFTDEEYFKLYISNLKIPSIEKDDSIEFDEQKDTTDTEKKIDLSKEEIIKELLELTKDKLDLQSIEFEKDDDTNHHIDFIMYSSNMRSLNYNIGIQDRLQVKKIAGKIIPAIATTTALVSGLACIELYKIFQGFDKLDKYKDTFCNLALPLITYTEPKGVNNLIINDKKYNMWSFDEVDKNTTLQQLIEKYSDCKLLYKDSIEIPLDLEYISYKNKIIYNSFMPSLDESCIDNKTLLDTIRIHNSNLDTMEELTISLGIDLDSDDDDDNNEYKNIEINPLSVRIII